MCLDDILNKDILKSHDNVISVEDGIVKLTGEYNTVHKVRESDCIFIRDNDGMTIHVLIKS